ncbi:MAG: FlgD immunoglobulin-like domain containing protein [candidate division Zixibacteria bacterium]|nr:FlgD immunoglobulin-like domain containing protein [candidate division Zixibacteria bacterium]
MLLLLISASYLPMGAVEFKNVTITKLANNSGNETYNHSPHHEFRSVVEFVDGPADCDAIGRYSSILTADVSAVGNDFIWERTSAYRIAFDVDALAGESWDIHVETWKKAGLTIIDDNGRKGWAYLYGTIGTISNNLSMDPPPSSISLPSIWDANNDADPDKPAYADAWEESTGRLYGVGPVVNAYMDFVWSSKVRSDFGTVEGGDEASVQMGQVGALDDVSSDDYPGYNGRTLANDGHFVRLVLEGGDFQCIIEGGKLIYDWVLGPPCTYQAWGRVEGCLGDNFKITVKFINRYTQAVICSQEINVTDGTRQWFVSCEGDCTFDFDIKCEVENEEGKCISLFDAADVQHDIICSAFALMGIGKVHSVPQGHSVNVPITISGGTPVMGGFDFLIAYDASALVFYEAKSGDLLDSCDWEYFTYRYGADGNCGDACPSGLLRLVALAETNNGPYHPSCYGPPDTSSHELAEMIFHVTNDRTYECQFSPISFFWADCGDNSVSSVDGNILAIDQGVYGFEGNTIWDEGNDGDYPEENRIPFIGAPDNCLNQDPNKPSLLRFLNFKNGGVDIVCADSIDARGDINCNGLANEIADAVMFTNYFIMGHSAFEDHVEASIAASDVNADGTALSVADLVYLIRIITGDALPYQKPLPDAVAASVNALVNHSAVGVSTTSATEIGAGYFVFEYSGLEIGQPQLINGASAMSLKYGNENGMLKVLVYSLEKGVTIPAGVENVFVIPIHGEGSIRLTAVQLSDYQGNPLTIKNEVEPVLPKAFALHQNYPNPFNAGTVIAYELPEASEVKIEIINVLGQTVVTVLDGRESAGIHTIQWNGTDNHGTPVASGIYVYRMTAGMFLTERKMVLLK